MASVIIAPDAPWRGFMLLTPSPQVRTPGSQRNRLLPALTPGVALSCTPWLPPAPSGLLHAEARGPGEEPALQQGRLIFFLTFFY